ncbi:hypothetical protein Q9L42_008495 [Methylomarinum sp. Ch1-1]|uniref:Pilus assembly protein PilP n=1 Tax=Methylomarinum roseum TaxID=3067653 RepID=A0AAU7NYT5_9GAMM
MKIYWVLCASLLVYQAASANGSANDHYSPRPGQTEAQWVRDPFTPSRQMYEIVGTQSGMARGAYGFVPSLEAERIPQMKLRGLINPDDKEFIALLEVKGVGTFMVREGDEFNIDPSQPKNAVRIGKITRLSVTVETGMLGSIRVLR